MRRRTRRYRGGGATAIALLFVAASLAVEAPMAGAARASAWLKARQADGSPAMAQVAGSFRTTAANALWVKVDAYHDEWEERGLDWTKNADLLPLLRAITYLDPHFVAAYDLHGFLLAKQNKPEQGVRILTEGIRNNPRHFQLYEAVGMIYARALSRPADAEPYFAKAAALAPDDFDRVRLRRTLERLRLREPDASPTPSAGRAPSS